MATKRAPARPDQPDRGLTKAEACRILQVAPSADEELITKAYWHLAHKYRIYASRDPEAREHLDELNRAYVVLNPGKTEAPLSAETPPPAEERGSAEQFIRWLEQLVEHTKARWPEHVGEVAVLTGTTTILTFLALAAGASPLWTVLAAGIAALTIWAPWRNA